MSLVAQVDTLEFQLKGRPLAMKRDISQVHMKEICPGLDAYMKVNVNNVKPETEALKFYLLNHAVAQIRGTHDWLEPLGKYKEVLDLYNNVCSAVALRAFYYLLLICSRESRHLQSGSSKSTKALDEVKTKYGTEAVIANTKFQCTGSGGVVDALRENLIDMKIGDYVNSLRDIFYKGSFSSGFGGKAWGQVTDCLVEFVHGRYSAEMMVDTVWTLCHNNGPIFNKGMLYAHYDGSVLKTILDVQRSGQIPQLLSDNIFPGFVDPELVTAHGVVKSVMHPESCYTSYVDWFAVEQLGSVGSYGNYKEKQKNKYGLPADMAEKEAAAAAAKAAAKKASDELAAMSAAQKKDKYFEVVPGFDVEKVKIERAA